jgi:hypothetical protein
MNWVTSESAKADSAKDRIILKNPGVVAALDGVLLGTCFPFIRTQLEMTGFRYMPAANDVRIESAWMGPELARELTFMLFDDRDRLFLRCALRCSSRGYMFEREFSLGLPETADPRFLVRILGDPRFEGYPPVLSVHRSVVHPEWDVFFWIVFTAGSGFDSGRWTMHNAAMNDIKQTIRDSCSMYDLSMIDGIRTMKDVERFLESAYPCFESV